jgi:hypothetical protein
MGTCVAATYAQRWQLQSYDAGYRVFEVDAVGNNPTTIAPLLKNPDAYLAYLNTITNNSLYGNPGILDLKTFYINAEWRKTHALSRFWKKYTLQTGLLLTSTISQQAGGIGEETFSLADTVGHRNIYSLVKKQQFLGINAGVNRRFLISRKFQFLIGFHAQGSVAIVHHYEPTWDSTTYGAGSTPTTHIIHMANLEGKHFFQWQLMIPLGLEYALFKQRLFIRLEADAGIVGGRFRPGHHRLDEAHGVGIWLMYALR